MSFALTAMGQVSFVLRVFLIKVRFETLVPYSKKIVETILKKQNVDKGSFGIDRLMSLITND